MQRTERNSGTNDIATTPTSLYPLAQLPLSLDRMFGVELGSSLSGDSIRNSRILCAYGEINRQ